MIIKSKDYDINNPNILEELYNDGVYPYILEKININSNNQYDLLVEQYKNYRKNIKTCRYCSAKIPADKLVKKCPPCCENCIEEYNKTKAKANIKSSKTKFEKYGSYTYNNRVKCAETKLTRYGSANYNNTLKHKETCLKRYGKEYYTNPEKMKQTLKGNINIIDKTDKHKIQNIVYNNIKTENKILNDRSLGFELDILIPDINLAIEYNGLLFHSQGLSNYNMFNTPNFDTRYHLDKTLKCRESGIQLFHIFEGENLDLWLSMINNKLGLNKRIYARKCIVKELESKDIKDFLDINHIQGFCNAKINLGLYYDNELVQVMTFSKPRFNKMYEFELIRLCSLRNVSVVGGSSKLLNYFIKNYKPKSIISYANRRFSNGSIYEKLGFRLVDETDPNYFYFKFNSTLLESRNKYQKHKLKDLLDNYDDNKSESENMFNNKYRRIYDCGNLVYELILK